MLLGTVNDTIASALLATTEVNCGALGTVKGVALHATLAGPRPPALDACTVRGYARLQRPVSRTGDVAPNAAVLPTSSVTR